MKTKIGIANAMVKGALLACLAAGCTTARDAGTVGGELPHFLADALALNGESPVLASGLELTRRYRIVYADAERISYLVTESSYGGGARGQTDVVAAGTVDRRGVRVHLGDVVPSERRAALRQAVQECAERRLGDRLLVDTVNISDDKWYLSADGLHFVYSEGEIAPHSEGVVDLPCRPLWGCDFLK